MKSIISQGLWRGALVGALICVGCTQVLDWDPEGLPCEEDVCADGYSCLVNACIVDDSIQKGHTCNQDIQCEGDLICASFKCATPCFGSLYYRSNADCGANEYCREQLVSVEGEAHWRGYCEVADSCVGGEKCGPLNDRLCVEITSTANACLVGCEIGWNGAAYDGSCGGSTTQIQYCQPLGQSERLVCRDTEVDGQEKGQECDLAGKTCKRGLACIEGYCRQYCKVELDDLESTEDQCGADRCCDQAQGTYAYCHPTCGG